MVNTRARATQPTTVKTVRTTKPRTAAFEIDPELLNDVYNQTRRPQLPYGIVVNDKPSGILIPTDQLDKAGWKDQPSDEDLSTITFGENEVTGPFFTATRLLVLAFVPEYIRYKDEEALLKHSADPTLEHVVVGSYDEYRNALDKRIMDVCSEHALVFLDDHNQPLHTTPIVVRFKNVALWSFKSAREEFYRKLEKAFADFTGQRYSGKSDKWRSLGILDVSFKAEKQGEGKNKSWCCKTEVVTNPDPTNLPHVFLGTPTTKAIVWTIHDDIAGFTEPQSLPALPGESEAVPALPAATQKLRSAKPDLEPDDELDDLGVFDTEAVVSDDDEFDFDEDLDDE
jgi:hypothetical protein